MHIYTICGYLYINAIDLFVSVKCSKTIKYSSNAILLEPFELHKAI